MKWREIGRSNSFRENEFFLRDEDFKRIFRALEKNKRKEGKW